MASRTVVIILCGALVLCGQARAGAAGERQGAQVTVLQREALRAARLEDRHFRGLLLRQRLAALLPQVGLSLGRGVVLSQRLTSFSAEPITVSGGDNESLALTARWDLSRLLFSRDDVALQVERQRAAQQGRRLAAEVARLYYERRALLLAEGAKDPRRLLRIAELTATLDALTGLTGLAGLPEEAEAAAAGAPAGQEGED